MPESHVTEMIGVCPNTCADGKLIGAVSRAHQCCRCQEIWLGTFYSLPIYSLAGLKDPFMSQISEAQVQSAVQEDPDARSCHGGAETSHRKKRHQLW